MTDSGLPNFSDAKSHTPSIINKTRDIRQLISTALEDDDFFQFELGKYLKEPGDSGTRQGDQTLIAEAIFNKVPVLRSYANLNHRGLWLHVSQVLSSYGYIMKAGRVSGHKLEYQTDYHVTKENVAEGSEAA